MSLILQSLIRQITILGSLASIVGVVIAVYFNRFRIYEYINEITGENAQKQLLSEIFGDEVEVERVDGEYGQRIQDAAADAQAIFRLSGNQKRIDGMDDFNQFKDPDVDTRLLVINPKPKDPDAFGDYYGRQIEHGVGRELDSDLSFLKGRYGTLNEYVGKGGVWKQTSAKAYGNTAWIRMVLFKGSPEEGWVEAGFTFSPTCSNFNEQTPMFWTKDPTAIMVLRSIFEDIWNDERTEDFEDMYERVFETKESIEPEE